MNQRDTGAKENVILKKIDVQASEIQSINIPSEEEAAASAKLLEVSGHRHGHWMWEWLQHWSCW